jgi:hypothetical protein
MIDERHLRMGTYSEGALTRVWKHGETPRSAAETVVPDRHEHLIEDVAAVTEEATVRALEQVAEEVSTHV